ncbi:MAG: transcription termination factor NusA [Candidatus Gracilibacteria bacterium]
MNKQFISAINQLCVEKNIPRDKVMHAVQDAIKTAYRKDFGNKDQNIDVTVDDESGFFTVYIVRQVVDTYNEEEEGFEELQILAPDAKKYKKDAKAGDEIRIDVTPPGFGRIAAQAAKQVILQRLQEAERDILFETFKEREDELLTAQVSRVDKGMVYVEIDRNTIPLPREERVQSERYQLGQRIKVYLSTVEQTTKGPRLVISRKSPQLVAKLFEFEIPEVKTKIVEIKGIAREAGVRTKVAVKSNDPKVDPIGACVGQKGVRIQTIMDEINNEMIDIVAYSDDIEKYISQALSPAKISVIELDQKKRVADVYVPTDQRPLAIGRAGQNVRLASILTGYEINLHDITELKEAKLPKEEAAETEAAEGEEAPKKEAKKPKKDIEKGGADDSIDNLDIADSAKKKLIGGGIKDISTVKQMSVEDLTMIGGIGKASAEKIKAAADKA